MKKIFYLLVILLILVLLFEIITNKNFIIESVVNFIRQNKRELFIINNYKYFIFLKSVASFTYDFG